MFLLVIVDLKGYLGLSTRRWKRQIRLLDRLDFWEKDNFLNSTLPKISKKVYITTQ